MTDLNQNGCLIVGDGVSITGKITLPGKLSVDGQIDGEVSAKEVQVGESGRITGKLVTAVADIRGELIESISVSEMLILRGTAKVRGNITYNALQIEQGAVIEGTLSKTEGRGASKDSASTALTAPIQAPQAQ